MTTPNCPYCDTSADNFEDIRNNPSDDWDFHYLQVTCGSCGEVYELCYDLQRVLHWDEDGEPSVTPI